MVRSLFDGSLQFPECQRCGHLLSHLLRLCRGVGPPTGGAADRRGALLRWGSPGRPGSYPPVGLPGLYDLRPESWLRGECREHLHRRDRSVRGVWHARLREASHRRGRHSLRLLLLLGVSEPSVSGWGVMVGVAGLFALYMEFGICLVRRLPGWLLFRDHLEVESNTMNSRVRLAGVQKLLAMP